MSFINGHEDDPRPSIRTLNVVIVRKLEREEIIPKLWKAGVDILADSGATYWRKYHDLDDIIWFQGQPPLMRIKFRDDQIAALFRKEMIASGTLIVASFLSGVR